MNDYKLVFFTDDDKDDLSILQEISELLGHTCKVFHSGIRLMTDIENKNTRPDIVFLDINMPLLDGYEIIKNIRASEELANIPIVIHTGNCDEACIQKCLELGANYFITKAFSYTEVKDAIEHAINKDWKNHLPVRGNFVYAAANMN